MATKKWNDFIGKYVKISYENGMFQSIGIVSDVSENFVKYHCLFQVRNGWNTFLSTKDGKHRIDSIDFCNDAEKKNVDKILKKKYNYIYNIDKNCLEETSESKSKRFIEEYKALFKKYEELRKRWKTLSDKEKIKCLAYDSLINSFLG